MTSQRDQASPKLASRPSRSSQQKLRLWLRLLESSRPSKRSCAAAARRVRRDAAEFDVMAALERRSAGMTMTELSRFLMVSNGNVTGIIDRLVAEGLSCGAPTRMIGAPPSCA